MTTDSEKTQHIEKVTELFWQKGFFNTSIADITLLTGLNRTLIYQYFQDKEGLFIACLNWYMENITAKVTKALLVEKPSIESLIAFYQQFLSDDHPFSNKGCLIMMSATDAVLHSARINQVIQNFVNGLHQRIYLALLSLPSKENRENITAMLIGHTFGLMSLLRMPDTKAIAYQQINGILTVLQRFKEPNNAEEN